MAEKQAKAKAKAKTATKPVTRKPRATKAAAVKSTAEKPVASKPAVTKPATRKPAAKSTTANTVDYVSVMVNAGAGTDICIARLKSGEAMILPARGGLATNNIMLAATDVAGAAGASVNGVAVEFLAFA